MNTCMLIELQLEAAECLNMKDLPCAFAIFKVRLFVFCQTTNIRKEAHTMFKQDMHITSIYTSTNIDFEIIWEFKVDKQLRKCLGFVHRHKLKRGSKIWQLGDIDLPIFRAWASRRKGKGKEHTYHYHYQMTERAPSARVKLQCISDAFKGGWSEGMAVGLTGMTERAPSA